MFRKHAIPILFCLIGSCYVYASPNSVKSQDLQSEIVIQRLGFDAQVPDLTLKLEQGIAIISDAPSTPEALARVYQPITTTSAIRLHPESGQVWSIVAVGPLLDSPDKVLVRKGTMENGLFHIEIVHTSARIRGATLRRNLPWRPILRLPIPKWLPPQQYQVEVVWRALESLPSGKPLAPPSTTVAIAFMIGEGAR